MQTNNSTVVSSVLMQGKVGYRRFNFLQSHAMLGPCIWNAEVVEEPSPLPYGDQGLVGRKDSGAKNSTYRTTEERDLFLLGVKEHHIILFASNQVTLASSLIC